MIYALCPNCKQEIRVGLQPEIGQRLHCTGCQAELEVIWLYPISLDYPENALLPLPKPVAKKPASA